MTDKSKTPSTTAEGSANASCGEPSPSLPPRPPNVSTDSQTTTMSTRKGKTRSIVWDHFTKIKTEDPTKPRAACVYCGTDYACDSSKNGTRTMLSHLHSQCKKSPFRNTDKGQTTLGFKPKFEGDSSGGGLVAVGFNVETCRQYLAEMVIIDELPFRIVEGHGFRRLMHYTCPKWTKIPSRLVVARDCVKVYLREKKKLLNAIKGQRVCLTTDTWTSVQNLNYMCVTAHFIDDDWTLHKRIINFCLVENHKGDTLGKAIEVCLLEWGITKLLTITVDNASSNNTMIQFLKKKTKNRPTTVLEHDFLHVRCCAHILNLIVREGLKELDDSIVKVRNAVRYVRSSPQRWSLFKVCAEKETITSKSQPCLDVPTRWNYTYVMLDKAEKFQKAFERLEEDDLNYLPSLREGCDDDEDDGGNSGRGRRGRRSLGPPDSDDWDKIRLFVKFLEIFYEATLRFSGSNIVTSNAFFPELMLIRDTIEEECSNREVSLRLMAEGMKAKFSKYWENFENMNILLYVALVLDPRYKLRYIQFAFKAMYDLQKADDLSKKVNDILVNMYDSYVEDTRGRDAQSNTSRMTQSIEGSTSSRLKGGRSLRMTQFMKQMEEENSLENKTEVEKYLVEGCEKFDDKFDVLAWWKINRPRFPILSLVARHILAIPVSTVASESAFSTAGRVLDPFRSSLSPSMVEALICTQDWLRSSSLPIRLRDAMNDIEEFEKLDAELMEEGLKDGLEATIIEDEE